MADDTETEAADLPESVSLPSIERNGLDNFLSDDNTDDLVSGCARIANSGHMSIFAPAAAQEGFENTLAGEGSICVSGPLSAATNGKCAEPGDVVGGVLLSDSDGAVGVYGNSWIEGLNGMSVGAAELNRVLTIELTGDQVGLDIYSDGTGDAEVRFYDSKDDLMATSGVRFGATFGGGPAVAFRGLSCDRPIGSIEVDPRDPDLQLVIDNLVFD